MSPRVLPGILALALLLAAPLAVAFAEGFSHEVAVEGRIVDAEGLPVAGVPVDVTFHNVTTLGVCLFGVRSDLTDGRGDFVVCRHAHELHENVSATIRVANETFEIPVDARLRLGIADLVLPVNRTARDPEGDRAFHATLHVAGRIVLAHPGGILSDGVNVTATPLVGMPVTLRLDQGSRVLGVLNATTDGNGDYAVDFATTEIPQDANVSAEAADSVSVGAVHATLRRVDLDEVRIPLPPPLDRPGTDVPRIPAPGYAAAGVILALVACIRPRRPRG